MLVDLRQNAVLLKKGDFVESKHHGRSENVYRLKAIDLNVVEIMCNEFQQPALSVCITANVSVFLNI